MTTNAMFDDSLICSVGVWLSSISLHITYGRCRRVGEGWRTVVEGRIRTPWSWQWPRASWLRQWGGNAGNDKKLEIGGK